MQAFIILIIAVKIVWAAPAIPELKVEKIQQGVYLHTSYELFKGWGIVGSNGLVAVDGKDAYIIDTPATEKDTKELVSWIKQQDLTLKAAIATHFHTDSSAGIAYLNSLKVPTFASEFTNELLMQAGRELATQAFKENRFWLVDNKIEAYYPGGGHSPDNLVVWLADHQILFGGCFVKAKSLGNLSDAVLPAWSTSAQKLITEYGNAKLVVPGHGRVGGTDLLTTTKQLAIKGLAKETLKRKN